MRNAWLDRLKFDAYPSSDRSPTRSELVRWVLWSCLLLGLTGAIGALAFYRSVPFPADSFAILFVLLAFTGHYIFFAFLALLPGVLLALVRPSSGWLGAVIGLSAFLFLLVLAVDIKVFELYRFHLNRMVLELLLGGAAGDIFAFSTRDVLLASGAATVVVAWVGFLVLTARQLARPRRGRRVGKWVVMAVLGVMFCGQLMHAFADAWNYRAILRQVLQIPAAQPLTMKRSLVKWGLAPAVGDAVKVDLGEEGGRLNYPLAPLQCAFPGPRTNLLIVLVDGLRFDMFNESVMPRSRQLAEEGWRFDNHLSTGNATRYGIFGFFYGLNGSYWKSFLAERRGPVLIDAFADNGYQFSIHGSAKLTSPEFDQTVFSRIRGQIPLATPGASKDARDRQITNDFLEFLNQRDPDKPFFGLLFFDSPHGYAYPADFPERFTPSLDKVSYLKLGEGSDPEPFRNRYRNSIAYVDTLIDEVVAGLADKGLLESTAIVISADHGQEFNETGLNYWGHNGDFSRWQTQVPLMVRLPGRTPAVFSHRSSHLDVAPTLLREIGGCQNPVADYSTGKYLDDGQDHSVIDFATWGRNAVMDRTQIMVEQAHGMLDYYDLDYRPKTTGAPNPAALQKVLKQRSRFKR